MEHYRAPERVNIDSYSLLAPHIQDAVDALSDDILRAMPPDEINRLSDEALRRSGLLHSLPPCQTAEALMEFAFVLTVLHILMRVKPPFCLYPGYHWQTERDADESAV